MAFLLFSMALNATEKNRSAEEMDREAQAKFADFDRHLSFQDRKKLKQIGSGEREQLSPRLRALFDERQRLKEETIFWENVVLLKRDLLKLPGKEGAGATSPESREAEAIAATAIRGFNELREEYEMVRPAIFHNMLVNMGIKEEGLCWQWARGLTKRLMKLDLKTFDLLWATARGGTMREHNTIVLVSHGKDLSEGLFLDGWKNSGKPFWMRVKDDKKHPWKVGSYIGDDIVPK